MEVEFTNTCGEETCPLEASMYGLEVIRLAGEVDEDISSNFAALEEKKREAKKKFINSCSKQLILETILNDEKHWPTLTDAAEELKAISRKLKTCKSEVEETKKTIFSLCETAGNAYVLLKSRIKELQKNVTSLETKKKILKELRGQQKEIMFDRTAEIQQAEENQTLAVIEQCQESIDKNQLHIKHLKLAINRVKERMEIIASLHDQSTEPTHTLQLERIQSMITVFEKLGGIKVRSVDDDKLQLEFDSQDNPNSDRPKLLLTLTFMLGSFNKTYLKDAEVNILSLDVKDILEEAVNNNNVVNLIHELKTRWFSHVPLLSEINKIQNSYAIDWIQEEGIIRVMAGRGGSIVFTLSIPSTYPVEGTVTLVDIKGTKTDANQLQENTQCKNLEEWVKYLEYKFGKP
ncbi:hypothetical protein SNE40_004513 [Patella caerulea]|uniref:Uncharacterized protein n=1 Tax=Patella caerulea TaxID=87958 RepID=A0AAN8K4W1_PATCE